MKLLSEKIIQFFRRQNFVVVSTVDKDGSVHNSCKGIVKIDKKGSVYLFDLYKGRTFNNLETNSNISLTAADEHRFTGYCLKGKAKKITESKLDVFLKRDWEERINKRITHRLIRNIHGEKGHAKHPEVILPNPEYLILMEVNKIVDLTPAHIK